jgi:hypothetical protein
VRHWHSRIRVVSNIKLPRRLPLISLTCKFHSLLYLLPSSCTYHMGCRQPHLRSHCFVRYYRCILGKYFICKGCVIYDSRPLTLRSLKNFSIFLRPYTHLAWTGTFLILADTFANFVLYVNQRPIYVTNCVNDASTRFENELKNAFGGMSNVTLDQSSDFYNCSRLWSDELKLSILVLLLMLVIYVSKLAWF